MESVRIRSFSGPHFLVFRLNTERYSVSFRIQSEWGKIWVRNTPDTDTFHAVFYFLLLLLTALLRKKHLKTFKFVDLMAEWWKLYAKLTSQKIKFPIKDFFSKYVQIHSFLWIWSYLLNKSLMESFIFCSVPIRTVARRWTQQLWKCGLLLWSWQTRNYNRKFDRTHNFC